MVQFRIEVVHFGKVMIDFSRFLHISMLFSPPDSAQIFRLDISTRGVIGYCMTANDALDFVPNRGNSRRQS